MTETTQQQAYITEDMTVGDVIEKYPEAAEVLFESGMHCFGCAMASFETLEQGCLAHGLDPDEIVNKINKKLEDKK